MVRKPEMGLFHNSKNAPGETKSPTPHQPAEMSSTKEQTREERIENMDSMCVMVKGKQTYLGLNRRQWIDRFLDWDPDTSIEELAEGDFHIVELGMACACPEDDDDLESVDSEDEEKEHEYKGKMYKGKELLDLWESKADKAKQDYKEYEKANKPSAKKQKIDKSDKSDKASKSDGAGAKGAKAKTGTAWSRFLNGNRTVLGPSIYKKYCDSVERDYEIPVKFTGPDGDTVFKVLDVGKYDEKFRWAKNPEQNLAEEGVDYY
jgi:hypothetical protein